MQRYRCPGLSGGSFKLEPLAMGDLMLLLLLFRPDGEAYGRSCREVENPRSATSVSLACLETKRAAVSRVVRAWPLVCSSTCDERCDPST